MPSLEATVPKINAPAVSLPSVSSTVAVGANVPSFSSVPVVLSPQLSLSSPTLATNVPTSISGVSAAFGGPESIGTSNLPSFNTTLPKLDLPAVPKIPGLDKAGILLGAGPKFVSEKITKYTTIVPPFAPGLKVNMAMVGGAVAIISALSSGNPSAILKSLAEDMVGDAVKGALDQTGVSGMQDQLKGIQDSASVAAGAVADATNTATANITPTITVSNNTPPTG